MSEYDYLTIPHCCLLAALVILTYMGIKFWRSSSKP